MQHTKCLSKYYGTVCSKRCNDLYYRLGESSVPVDCGPRKQNMGEHHEGRAEHKAPVLDIREDIHRVTQFEPITNHCVVSGADIRSKAGILSL